MSEVGTTGETALGLPKVHILSMEPIINGDTAESSPELIATQQSLQQFLETFGFTDLGIVTRYGTSDLELSVGHDNPYHITVEHLSKIGNNFEIWRSLSANCVNIVDNIKQPLD